MDEKSLLDYAKEIMASPLSIRIEAIEFRVPPENIDLPMFDFGSDIEDVAILGLKDHTPEDELPNTPSLIATLHRFDQAYLAVAASREQLKKDEEFLKSLSENDVVEAMDAEEKVAAVTPMLGLSIVVTDQVRVNVTKKEMPMACDWFIRNGHKDLVKRDFTVSFGAKEQDASAHFHNELNALLKKEFPGKEIEIERTVHGKTLKSFVTKHLRKGSLADLPSWIAVFIPRLAEVVGGSTAEEI